MATFPHNLCGIRQDGHAEQHTPVVSRSEVERGMPRQRRTSADARVSVPCTLVFRSAAAAAEFEAWYYAEGSGWFDFTLPRTGAVVEARIIGGDIGGLTPITPAWNASERSITLEYIRPGFVQLPPGLHSVNPARVLSVQRNSTATYVDDAGVLQTAAANVLRYQGGLMLVEGESSNRILQSQAINSSPWSGGTRTLAAEFWAGTVPFFKVAKALGTISEGIRSGMPAVAAGSTWTMTLALLADNKTTCTVGILANVTEGAGGNWGAPGECTKEIISGPGVFSIYSTAVGSLWNVDGLSDTEPTLIRITRTLAPTSTVTTISCMVYPGRATSTTIGDAVKITRVQMEPGAAATSYIPTTTAAATRAADIITVAA